MTNSLCPPRYLASFHPKRVLHRFTDVLVLGSGLAGLRAAMAVDPSQDVLIVTKERASQSNSHYAQGGIAAVWDPGDCFESHVEDTLGAGKGLCDPAIVELVVREAPQRVAELMEWGADFDRVNGELSLTREGGHSFNRILHALGDSTGKEVIRAALARAERLANICILEDTFSIDLLTENGRCRGALTWAPATGVQMIWARETILATGGCGQLYRETTNPRVATGDGLAMAYRAGAELLDMEFLQFHPTVLYVAGSARTLVSETVRGEGAFLRDREGVRFMPDYDQRAELAPRDVVSMAIVSRMAQTRHPCVYLDLSHLDPDKVRRRFPGITASCRRYGLDFGVDLIPVRPGAHYMIGGIRTDRHGRTNVDNLWACGEVAATGLHGANRLASNSLLEALVFGYACGAGAGRSETPTPVGAPGPTLRHEFTEKASEKELDLVDIRNSLSSLMFRDVGILRDAVSLRRAAESVDFWSRYVLGQPFAGPEGWELQNLLTVAGLIIRHALTRAESRGTHQRTDCAQTDDRHWRGHLVSVRSEAGVSTKLATSPAPEPTSPSVQSRNPT